MQEFGHAAAWPGDFGHEKGRGATPGRSVSMMRRRPSGQHYPRVSMITSRKKKSRPGGTAVLHGHLCPDAPSRATVKAYIVNDASRNDAELSVPELEALLLEVVHARAHALLVVVKAAGLVEDAEGGLIAQPPAEFAQTGVVALAGF